MSPDAWIAKDQMFPHSKPLFTGVFAGTHSIMGKGGGMFRSTNNGDTWAEQNNGFTALDVNSVAVNSLGHIFAGAAGGVFRSTNDADNWSDISSGLLPPGGNVWAVAIDSERLPLPELVAPVYFAACNPQ
jgi:photosystem II stability/assembly factor-like uncharacterized protein